MLVLCASFTTFMSVILRVNFLVKTRPKRVFPCSRTYLLVIPLKIFFRSLSTSEIPGGSGNSQSCNTDFDHEDSSNVFTCKLILNWKRPYNYSGENWVLFLKITCRGITCLSYSPSSPTSV